jgi:hypothetical protein
VPSLLIALQISTNNIAIGMVAVTSTLSIYQKYDFLPLRLALLVCPNCFLSHGSLSVRRPMLVSSCTRTPKESSLRPSPAQKKGHTNSCFGYIGPTLAFVGAIIDRPHLSTQPKPRRPQDLEERALVAMASKGQCQTRSPALDQTPCHHKQLITIPCRRWRPRDPLCHQFHLRFPSLL